MGGEAEKNRIYSTGEVTISVLVGQTSVDSQNSEDETTDWCVCVCFVPRESLLVEMGVSIKEDGGTLGVFSPKGVSSKFT